MTKAKESITTKKNKQSSTTTIGPSEKAWRESIVRKTAYYLYEQRGRVDGNEFDDWIRAEEIFNKTV